jgi:hypothetical protein
LPDGQYAGGFLDTAIATNAYGAVPPITAPIAISILDRQPHFGSGSSRE